MLAGTEDMIRVWLCLCLRRFRMMMKMRSNDEDGGGWVRAFRRGAHIYVYDIIRVR